MLVRSVLGALSVLVAIASSGHAQVCQDGGPTFPRIALVYGAAIGPSSSPAELASYSKYDLLVGYVWGHRGTPAQRAALAERIATIRSSKNSPMTIVNFELSGPYIRPQELRPNFPTLFGPLYDINQQFIPGWPGTYMLNLSVPALVDYMAALPLETLNSQTGISGVFYDSMGPGFDRWACNIETGALCQPDANFDHAVDDPAWLDATWSAAKIELARKSRENMGNDAIFMANNASRESSQYLNGILLEDFLDYVLEGKRSWNSVVDDYLFWTRNSKQPTTTTIVSSSGIDIPLEFNHRFPDRVEPVLNAGKSLEHRMRFGLGTTLLGNGYFGYDLSTNWRGQQWWYNEYDVALGCPLGEAQKLPSGLWRRDFSGGVVHVNPTNHDVEISLPPVKRQVVEDTTLCPDKSSKQYKKICPVSKQLTAKARCDKAFNARKKQVLSRGRAWKGKAQRTAREKRKQCKASVEAKIKLSCACRVVPRSREATLIWRDSSSLEVNDHFVVPFLDARLFTEVESIPKSPERLIYPNTVPEVAPQSPTVTKREETVVLRAPTGVDVRISTDGQIQKVLVDGRALINTIIPSFVLNSDWKPFGLIAGSVIIAQNEAIFTSSSTAPDSRRMHQTLRASVDESSINLEFVLRSEQDIRFHSNRLAFCVDMSQVRGTLMKSDVGDRLIPLEFSGQATLLNGVRSVTVGGLTITFKSPVSIFDARSWKEDCVRIFSPGPSLMTRGTPWASEVKIQKSVGSVHAATFAN